MTLGLIGKKLGTTKIFDTEGNAIPVSVIALGPCYVIQIRTEEKDKYTALQLGFEPTKPKRKTKPELRHLNKAKVGPLKILKEFRVNQEEAAKFEAGQEITVDLFKEVKYVDIAGRTKGKGFAGVMKRHHFHGFPATRGTHESKRHAGSIGCRYPQHVLKGHKMPGQLGNQNRTVQNLQVVEIRKEDNLMLVKGAVPGWKNGYLFVEPAIKKH